MKSFLLKDNKPIVKWSMVPNNTFFEGELPGKDYNLAVCPTDEKMVIVDIDCKEGKGNGYDNIPSNIFKELIQSYNYKTKSGGMHVFLRYTGDKVLLNTTSKLSIDLRIGKNKITGNNGGYVRWNGGVDPRTITHLINETSPDLNLWLESLFQGVKHG